MYTTQKVSGSNLTERRGGCKRRKVSSMAASRIVSGASVTWASQGAFFECVCFECTLRERRWLIYIYIYTIQYIYIYIHIRYIDI